MSSLAKPAELRPPPLLPRPWPIGAWLLAAGFLLVGLALYLFNPAENRFYPGCLFHNWTGLDCPGCGALRATHQLLHGHITAAFHFNALYVCSLPVLAWIGVRAVIGQFRPGQMPAFRTGWMWVGLILLIVFGVVRNLPAARSLGLAP
jgi:hypothetical protein